MNNKITACATAEIINEYEEIVQEMIKAMEIVEPISQIKICRDSDEDKFLECAKDSKSVYIVSGDKDLLVVEKYENIQIITAKDFCEKYLQD